MADTTITNGNTAKIINRQDAAKVVDDEHDAHGFIIYVDADIRLVREEEKEQARHGHPIKSGTQMWDVDPKGVAMYAYADGADATVSVTLQKWTITDMG